MAKNLARILDSDMPRLPLRKAAEQLRKKGRGRDTMLAHITPEEAKLLKARGGSGTINPDTGLPEFDDSFFSSFDFNLPTEISTPIESGNFSTSNVQPPDFVTQPAFGSNVDQASVDATRSTYGEGPFGSLTQYVGNAAGSDPNLAMALQTERGGVDPNLLAFFQGSDTGIPVPTARPSDAEFAAYNQPAGAASDVAALTGDSNKPGGLYAPPSFEEFQKGVASAEGKAAPATGGFQTPFGTLGTKDLIAALGIGGLGLNYLNAQNQGKKAAAQLKAAYDTAAQQQMQQAQPFMQQGGQQLSQALTGALSPAQQQQLQAAQAQAAQSTAGKGGAGAAQAGRSIEDLRQRLLANQQTMALSLLGAGTPMVNAAIQAQLQGTTSGINTQMQLSQQAGQAATGMLGMLAMMYGRSA